MTDLSMTIDPKSDQLNSDDLIAGPKTITVTRVTGNQDKDQPVSIFFDGDNGKPFKPCKSMRRVLVQCWGKDGNAYAGRSMTLYRDPKVKFGGIEVGGIRISHLSHIDADIQLMLTATRGKKDAYQVKKLTVTQASTGPSNHGQELLAAITGATDMASLSALVPRLTECKEQKLVPAGEFNSLRTAYGVRQKQLEALALGDDATKEEAAE
jgi:hypothetical protein